MKKLVLLGIILFMCKYSSGQIQQATIPVAKKYPEPAMMTPEMTEIWEPEVKIIQPGAANSDAPSDAIVLFNGTDVNSEWTDEKGNPTMWIVKDGALISVKGAGFIKSRRKFENFQLHIEWKTPSEVTGESQGRGNSGVFFRNFMKYRFLTVTITAHTVMDRQDLFINSMLLL